MSDITQHISTYLQQGSLLQIATVRDNAPWVATVYFVAGDDMKLYWLSYPTRRHSKDIGDNSLVAGTIVIKQDVPVIGVQLEGEAREVRRASTVAKVMMKYVAKYGVGKNFYKNFKIRQNKHSLYEFVPRRIVLFDEVNYGHDNPQELIVA